MSETTVTVAEADRQMLLLALAHLAVERPGWNEALARIAGAFGGAEEYAAFIVLRFESGAAGVILCGGVESDTTVAWAMASGGCGRTLALVDGYRCLDCTRWFHRPCAADHFGRSIIDGPLPGSG